MKMKKGLIVLLLLATVFTLNSCGSGGDDEDETPTLTAEEQRLLDLAGTSGITYVATSVTFEGSPDPRFDDFTLRLRGTATNKTYITTDGEPVFQPSGSWTFNGTNINQILIDRNTNNTFVLSSFNAAAGTFTITVNFAASGGVASGISGTNGTYIFNLEKQ